MKATLLVGNPACLGAQTVGGLMEVQPDASENDEPTGYKNKHITQVPMETMYQQALAVVAASQSDTTEPGDPTFTQITLATKFR